jgi:hypothetical protein
MQVGAARRHVTCWVDQVNSDSGTDKTRRSYTHDGARSSIIIDIMLGLRLNERNTTLRSY